MDDFFTFNFDGWISNRKKLSEFHYSWLDRDFDGDNPQWDERPVASIARKLIIEALRARKLVE